MSKRTKQQIKREALLKVYSLNLKKEKRITPHRASISEFNKTDFDWSKYIKLSKTRTR